MKATNCHSSPDMDCLIISCSSFFSVCLLFISGCCLLLAPGTTLLYISLLLRLHSFLPSWKSSSQYVSISPKYHLSAISPRYHLSAVLNSSVFLTQFIFLLGKPISIHLSPHLANKSVLQYKCTNWRPVKSAFMCEPFAIAWERRPNLSDELRILWDPTYAN